MKDSTNLLTIDSVSVIPDALPPFAKEALVNFTVYYMCRITGKKMLQVEYISKHRSSNQNEAVRGAIENFINGIAEEVSFKHYDVQTESQIKRGTVDAITILMPEPYKSMFEVILNHNNWKVEDISLPESAHI